MPFRDPIVGGTTLVRPAIQSPNYVAGTSGWTINQDGTAELAELDARGTITSSDPGGEWHPITVGAGAIDFGEDCRIVREADSGITGGRLLYVFAPRTDGTGKSARMTFYGPATGDNYAALALSQVDDLICNQANITTDGYVRAESYMRARSTVEVAPTGAVIPWAGNGSLPSGWLLCNGGAVSRTAYADLFAVVGTTYGPGDGSTTFNLPNLSQRYVRGAVGLPGATGGSSSHSHPLSSLGGALVTLAAAASATIRIARHAVSSWNSTQTINTTAATNTAVSSSTAVDLVGATDSTSTEPPYLELRYIIAI